MHPHLPFAAHHCIRCEIEAEGRIYGASLAQIAHDCAKDLTIQLQIIHLPQHDGQPTARITLRIPQTAVSPDHPVWSLAYALSLFCPDARVGIEFSHTSEMHAVPNDTFHQVA